MLGIQTASHVMSKSRYNDNDKISDNNIACHIKVIIYKNNLSLITVTSINDKTCV